MKMTAIFEEEELNAEERRLYKKIEDKLPRTLSHEQLIGLIGEIKAVCRFHAKLRRMYLYPFAKPRIEYTPNFTSAEPDIKVKIGTVSLAIEVKNWRFPNPITGNHVRDKVANKKWGHGLRLFLSVNPKELTEAATRRLHQAGIIYVNGINRLLETIGMSLRKFSQSFPFNAKQRHITDYLGEEINVLNCSNINHDLSLVPHLSQYLAL